MSCLKCDEIPDETKHELRSCYESIEVESLRILEEVNASELEPELKHLDCLRSEFEKICVRHNGLVGKFKKKPGVKHGFLHLITCGLW